MAVSGGGEDEATVAHRAIAVAPGTAQFHGVWLIGEAWGQQAASPNVGLTLDGSGLTVTGPSQGQSNTLPWTWVQRFRPGAPMSFPDGTPATVVEVGLIGRSITLLVPPAQLREEEIEELNRYLPAQVAAPPPPVPPPSPVTANDFRGPEQAHADDGPKHDVSPAEKQKLPQKRKGNLDNRTFRLAMLLGVLVVVAIAGTVVVALHIRNDQNVNAGIVVPQSTPTTLPPAPSTLSGPPESAKAATVAREVSLAQGDLPAGWTKVVVHLPHTSVPSAFANVLSAADANLASCVGLPLSHIGVITGGTEPGGPKVWPSSIFVLNSGLRPSAISVMSLVSNAGVERSDLAALLKPGIAHCLDNFYDASYSSEHISIPPTVNRFSVPEHAGEQVIALDVHIGITSNGHQTVYDYDVVLIGAGRLEIALGAQQNNEPFPNATLDRVAESMEARAAAVAGSH